MNFTTTLAASEVLHENGLIHKVEYAEISDVDKIDSMVEHRVNTSTIQTTDCTAMITFDDGCSLPVKATQVTQMLSESQFQSGDMEREYVSTIVVDLADITESFIQTRGSHTHEEWKGVAHNMVKAYAKNYYTKGTIADGGSETVEYVVYNYASSRFTNSDGQSVLSNRKISVQYGGKKLLQDGGKHVNYTASWNVTSNTETKKRIPIQEKYEELYHTFKNTVSCTVTRAGVPMNLSVTCLDANGAA